MRAAQLLVTLVSVSSLASAWPWPESLGSVELQVKRGVENILYGRQDSGDEDASESPSASDAAQTSAPTASRSGVSESDKATITESPSGSARQSGSATRSGSGSVEASGSSGSSGDETTEFDPRLPAGGVQMVTPAPLAGAQYYKIGDKVTFGWNYTSLSVTPSAVDVMATCTLNQQMYTIAANMSTEKSDKVVWDTAQYDQMGMPDLITEMYTLIIYDAASAITAIPQAGYLGVFRSFTFGMYQKQDYNDLQDTDYKCATCLDSGARAIMERQSLGMMLTVMSVTMLSFTFFATGRFGIL